MEFTMNKNKGYNPKNEVFYSFWMTEIEDGIYLYNDYLDKYMHSQCLLISAAQEVCKRPCIMVDSNFGNLPKYAKQFFMHHEIGHIKLGHLRMSKFKLTMTTIVRLLGILPKIEVQADAYAASVVGKENAIKALELLLDSNLLPITKREMERRIDKIKKLR